MALTSEKGQYFKSVLTGGTTDVNVGLIHIIQAAVYCVVLFGR